MRVFLFERISPKKWSGKAPGTTFYVASKGAKTLRPNDAEQAMGKLWDCKLTVLGEQFDFSVDPDLYRNVIIEAFEGILSGGETESRFHIPDFDAEVGILSNNGDSYRLILRFGGKEVERYRIDRSTLLGLFEEVKGT